MMKTTTKNRLIRIAMLLAATAVILLLLPRTDHQSFTYELNQPWRYQLLTADFDMPILRDSTSARVLRDSIDRNFIPIVKRNPDLVRESMTRFRAAMADKMTPQDFQAISSLLNHVYARGVVEAPIYDKIHSGAPHPQLRIASEENGAGTVNTFDASDVYSPAKAFEYIDSAFNSGPHGESSPHKHKKEIARTLNALLQPNLIADTVMNAKVRDQEYLNVNAALGVIKKGQRIVDRGEIITPQIYTNLNTYMEMLDKEQGGKTRDTYFIVGQALYILVCFGGLYLFLGIFRRIFYTSIKKMAFLMVFITGFVVFAILMFEYLRNGMYFVPFATVPVVILVFFDSRTAIFSMIVTVMVSALVAVYPLQFIFLEFSAALLAAFSINTLTQRSQLLRTALLTFVAYVVTYTAMLLISEGDLANFEWRLVGAFAINSVALSFAYILIVAIEKTFGFTSSVTLVELSDINNPLLRRLAEEAPGTFQHSMQVSTLAAEAARAVGANTQLVRTGALYHDIGKLESPIFFTENQHGVNPHQGLNPATSAQKIISHVTAGLSIAQKAKLPAVIRDFISEHHGRSVTRYFYNTAVNENPDKEIDRSKFTYPGPNPRSKETTILMMADSVEAASRSLKDYSSKSINDLVDRIIDTQEADGLYKDSPISFRDVETIRDTFKKRLATIYHSRVVYPELKKRPSSPALEEDSGKTAQ